VADDDAALGDTLVHHLPGQRGGQQPDVGPDELVPDDRSPAAGPKLDSRHRVSCSSLRLQTSEKPPARCASAHAGCANDQARSTSSWYSSLHRSSTPSGSTRTRSGSSASTAPGSCVTRMTAPA